MENDKKDDTMFNKMDEAYDTFLNDFKGILIKLAKKQSDAGHYQGLRGSSGTIAGVEEFLDGDDRIYEAIVVDGFLEHASSYFNNLPIVSEEDFELDDLGEDDVEEEES